MAKKETEYKLGDTLNIRCTEKAGCTDDVLDFLNSDFEYGYGTEVFKALRFWIKMKKEEANAVKVRELVERETHLCHMASGHYKGRKIGSANKKEEKGKKIKTVKEIKKVAKTVVKPLEDLVAEPSAISASNIVSIPHVPRISDYEADMFGGGGTSNMENETEKKPPLLRALKSIQKE